MQYSGLRVGTEAVFFAALCMALVAYPSCVWAADWPQFLGPDRNGIAADAKGLPRAWPPGGPKVLWKVPVGVGFAGPAVYGDSVLVLDREADARDVLRRLSLADGREIWRFTYDAPGRLDHNGSRTTPATDGKLVFAVGPFGHIHAVSFADGKLVWKAHLLNDWQAQLPQWAVATSPLLYGQWVIFAPWGRKAALVACQKETGRVVWTTPNPGGVAQDYQSPVPMMFDGKMTIVANGRQGYTIGVDAQTGVLLWDYTGYPKTGWNIPSPIIVPDDRVLITGGYNAGSAMIKLERQGDKIIARELWKNNNMASKTGQALIYGGYIYGNNSDRNGGLRCLSLDGQIQWTSPRPNARFDLGNVLIADGLLFVISGADGQFVMAEASPAGYKELGRAALLKGPEAWAPMAYSNGKLLLRDQTTLMCLDLAGTAAPR